MFIWCANISINKCRLHKETAYVVKGLLRGYYLTGKLNYSPYSIQNTNNLIHIMAPDLS